MTKMGIEISTRGGPAAKEAANAGKSQATAANNKQSPASTKGGSSGADKLQLSSQAAQLQALEAEIANLPMVDTQRVQDVQRTLATGMFEVVPARVADKLLTFEAGLGEAP